MLFAADWHADTLHLASNDPPPAPELFARRAFDLLERGDYSDALLGAREGTLRFPDYSTGWFVQARAEFKLRDYPAAQASVERCLALEPGFASAWGLLESIHVQSGRLAAARSARQRLEEILLPPALLDLAAPDAVVAPAPKVFDTAPRTSRSALILVKPGTGGSFETPTLAEVYRRQGLLDRALGVYRRILERHPEDVGAQAMVNKLEDELAARRRPTEAV